MKLDGTELDLSMFIKNCPINVEILQDIGFFVME